MHLRRPPRTAILGAALARWRRLDSRPRAAAVGRPPRRPAPCRHPGRHAQHRLRDLQPAQPHHQGAGLARGRARATRASPSTGSSRPARTRPTRRSAPPPSTSAPRPARRRSWRARTARPSRSSTSTPSPNGRPSSSRPGSPITSVADLKGKNIAATKGTDPYFFLLQSLEEAGVALERRDRRDPPARRRLGGAPERLGRRVGGARSDHGRRRGRPGPPSCTATSASTATASSTPPSRSSAQAGRRPDRGRRLREGPGLGAGEPRGDRRSILAEVAGLDLAVATKVITERINLDVDPVPGEAQSRC